MCACKFYPKVINTNSTKNKIIIIFGEQNIYAVVFIETGAHIRGEIAGLQLQKTPETHGTPESPPPKKNNTLVDTTILNVLCDLPFRRNQPQNSADDPYIRTLKNVLWEAVTVVEGIF